MMAVTTSVVACRFIPHVRADHSSTPPNCVSYHVEQHVAAHCLGPYLGPVAPCLGPCRCSFPRTRQWWSPSWKTASTSSEQRSRNPSRREASTSTSSSTGLVHSGAGRVTINFVLLPGE
ncbi:unnamed protein product [Amoebophrya sp. A25]|nr:unnamed protein product [Amoebophrya sp. A25]|eukprot:GSA25T00020323001.1